MTDADLSDRYHGDRDAPTRDARTAPPDGRYTYGPGTRQDGLVYVIEMYINRVFPSMQLFRP